MKNFEALLLYKFLVTSNVQLKMDFKTRLVMKKNLSVLKEFNSHLAEIEGEKNSLSPELKEFEKVFVETGGHCLEKDESGEVRYINGTFRVIPGKMDEIQKIRTDLLEGNEVWKKEVEMKEAKEKEWFELLNTDIDFELTKVSINGFEELKLDNNEWGLLEFILLDEV
jgi:hypothetical protein